MADAAAGIRDVAGVARDDVEMELRHRLAGGGAVVEAEVEGIWGGREFCAQLLLRPIDPDKEAGFLGAGELLEPGDGAAGDDEGIRGIRRGLSRPGMHRGWWHGRG